MESQLADFIEIDSPERFFRVVESLRELQAQGVIVEVGGNCKLAEIVRGEPWPDDMITIEILEPATGLKFSLSCNTYKGGGRFMKIS